VRRARAAVVLVVAGAAACLLSSPARTQESRPPETTSPSGPGLPEPSEAAGGRDSALPERSELIRRILASTAQLRSEREGGGQRAASGVVLATDPAAGRVWILTTLHFLEPPKPQKVYVRLPGRDSAVPGTVAFLSRDLDLAIIETAQLDVAPIRMQLTANLGAEILVVAFPWGQRVTVVRGTVSQLDSTRGDVVGPPHMVDASVSYGSSGGGVFDAKTGELLGIVQSYRTAKVAIPEMRERVLEVPVAGETTLISAATIMRFLEASNLKSFLP
jgi:serine protease Do